MSDTVELECPKCKSSDRVNAHCHDSRTCTWIECKECSLAIDLKSGKSYKLVR